MINSVCCHYDSYVYFYTLFHIIISQVTSCDITDTRIIAVFKFNKKVLLRERKRHTARHVSTTPSAVLSWEGVPHPWIGGPHPDLAGGGAYLIPGRGTPSQGTPRSLTWPGGGGGEGWEGGRGWGVPHPWRDTPIQEWSTPVRSGVPPWEGTWDSHWGTPQKGHGASGSIMGWRWGTPPPPPPPPPQM